MLYRAVFAMVALALLPSAAKCELVTWEMTTAATLGPNAVIYPSSASIEMETAPSSRLLSLPDVLFSSVNGNQDGDGQIDLNLNLKIGAETISHTGVFTYRYYSRTSGPGAHGATTNLRLRNRRIEFKAQSGTFTLWTANAGANLLGKPQNSFVFSDLSLDFSFKPVPEPSGCTLLLLGVAILCCRHRLR